MTIATEKLINRLSEILDKNKYLLLSGGTASGKTFITDELIKQARFPQYNTQGSPISPSQEFDVISERVQIHPSYTYDDFVVGVAITPNNGNLTFKYQDKVFLNILKNAVDSVQKKEKKKYILVIEDIGRSLITGIMGDVLPLLETHGYEKKSILLKTGERIFIPQNFYIIATKCTTIDDVNQEEYGFFRHFYHYSIESDYSYISDGANALYGDYDLSPNSMFYRAKRIVIENLRYRNQMSQQDIQRYVLGHGIFKSDKITMVLRYQVIPLLKQYLKDGILDRTAKARINAVESLVTGHYTKDQAMSNNSLIKGYRTDVTQKIFYDEALTHRPIVNMVARIKEQGLLCDTDIIETILFNPGVLVRKGAKIDGVNHTYPSPGYLFVERSQRDVYVYGTTRKQDGSPKRPRFFYSSKQEDILVINGVEYAAASEMQPKEYTRWSSELNDDNFVNERASSSPNSTMFRILRSYYKCLDKSYAEYLLFYPEDENIRLLKEYAKVEFDDFIHFVEEIGSGSDEADVNLERNRQFRERISQLVLLWKNIGDELLWNGQSITVEGVYKVSMVEKYKEYAQAMNELGIHQMIMQGPPGTSKTHSSREFLKYLGRDSEEEFLSDEQLDKFQISSYKPGGPISSWMEINKTAPKIAWDIVQFHPSYGYEDFVRGIEVTTIKNQEETASSISYDTVNKTLGKMADLASQPEYKDTLFVLVIDEINRANLATVFGELIYGLEYRGRHVATPYTVGDSNKVVLPNNLYILGTMNTADKSIGGIDYAIRRRFLFFSLLPNREVITSYNLTNCDTDDKKSLQMVINEKAAKLFDEIEKLFASGNLNPEYYKDDIQIGHTYFLVSSEEQLYLRFKYQIIPILREYYKDGMFQFNGLDTDDNFNGLIQCITGRINLNSDEKYLKDVFEKLME